MLLQEAFRHCKIWVLGDGPLVLTNAGIGLEAPGVMVADKPDSPYLAELVRALGRHRYGHVPRQ